MSSLLSVGVAAERLSEVVEGAIWARWVTSEPALAEVSSLAQLRFLEGPVVDEPLGALVRLAARDGGDDELAGIAVVHQLERGVRKLMRTFRDRSDDVEAIVVGALWEQIRVFPWRRRTRAYAANLLLDTKRSVVGILDLGRPLAGGEPLLLLDSMGSGSEKSWERPLYASGVGVRSEESMTDLVVLLRWARGSGLISGEDLALLVELVEAGYDVADQETRRTARGVCSEAAMSRVARRRGVSSKTILRRRNRAIAALRDGLPHFVGEVA